MQTTQDLDSKLAKRLVLTTLGMGAIVAFMGALAYGQATTGHVTVACAKGMRPEACQRDVAALAPLLNRFDAGKLGTWQFVIQNSNDWPRPNHPGMTVFEDRQTYLESALFEGKSSRAAEIMFTWHETIDTFAAHVVSHELAHIECRSRDEDLAEDNGQRIRNGEPVFCGK